MIKARALIVALLVILNAKQTERIQPRAETLEAEPETISLALTERLTIPLLGAISQSIEYIPKNSGECKFTQFTTRYKEMAQRSLDRHQGSIVTSILTLTSHELVFTIDQFFFLSVYSLSEKNMLKEQVSTRKIIEDNSTQEFSNPKLIVTPDQKVVYVLSPFGYSYFEVDSLSTDIKKVSQTPVSGEFYEGLIFDGHLFTASGVGGVEVLRIEPNHDLKLVNTLRDMVASDIKMDITRKLLYVLDYNNGINIYDITNPVRPILHDKIELHNLTSFNVKLQVNDNTILVLFRRANQNAIAELNYDHSNKDFAFIRYFKIRSNVVEMHLMDTHFIALGEEFLGIFPVGIHPKLIREELNGYVSLSPIKTAKVYEAPFFVGITETSIVLGAIDIGQKETIECTLDENSTLKKIIYKANLTSCGTMESRSYYDYCEYEKEFNVKQMEIVAHSGVAGLVWVLLLVFGSLFIVAAIFLFIMRAKKVSKIRKMELEFEQKRTNIALPSARMTDRIGSDART